MVGTYRVLTPAAARRAGSFYSDTEFDLTRLRPLRDRMVELGRSCVHADHRSGVVILALWGALAQFMEQQRHGDRDRLRQHLDARRRPLRGQPVGAPARDAPRAGRIPGAPRVALPVDDLDQSLDVEAPALIKGYLRMGAKVLGAPAWDPEFNTADLPMLTRVADIPARYQRHFLA